MKVKSIVDPDPDELEARINTLIDGKKIIDIKYLISPQVKVGDMTLCCILKYFVANFKCG